MRRATLRAGWLCWVREPRRGRSPSRSRRSAVLELLRLEERDPPSSLLNTDASRGTAYDLRYPPLPTSATPPLIFPNLPAGLRRLPSSAPQRLRPRHHRPR